MHYFEAIKKYSSSKLIAPAIFYYLFNISAWNYGSKQLDDQDRSDKYTAKAMAKMY